MANEDYRNIPVKFFYRDVKQGFESKKQGKPIWKTEEFISIMKPGNSKDIMEREVKPLDIERWGKIYYAWKNKDNKGVSRGSKDRGRRDFPWRDENACTELGDRRGGLHEHRRA